MSLDSIDTLNETINYYVSQLIIQYNNKPNAQGIIKALTRTALANDILFQIQNAFHIETAIGYQLDIIGKWVGINRYFNSNSHITSNPPAPFFSFTDTAGMLSLMSNPQSYPINICSFGDTTNRQIGKFLEASDIISLTQQLNDSDFRTLIKFKILCNTINGSYQAIYDGIYNYFGTDIIITVPENMTLSVWLNATSAPLANIAFQKGCFPKPMAVRIQFIISVSAPFFSFTDTAGMLSLMSNPQSYPINICSFGDTTNRQIGKFLSENNILN